MQSYYLGEPHLKTQIANFDPLKFPIFFLACPDFIGKLSTKHGVTRDTGRN